MNDSAMNLTKTLLLGGALLASNSLWAAAQSSNDSGSSGCCASATAPSCPQDPSALQAPTDEQASPEAGDAALSSAAEEVLKHYLLIQDRLANDTLKDISAHAEMMIASALGDQKLTPLVAEHAELLSATRDLRSARDAFKALSRSFMPYALKHEASIGYVEVYCGMAKAGWLQAGVKIRNPYYGSSIYGPSMLNCGTVRSTHGNPQEKQG